MYANQIWVVRIGTGYSDVDRDFKKGGIIYDLSECLQGRKKIV